MPANGRWDLIRRLKVKIVRSRTRLYRHRFTLNLTYTAGYCVVPISSLRLTITL